MKAVQINAYGGTEVLELNPNTPNPNPQKDQILVNNHASCINPFDGKLRNGYLKEHVPLKFPATLGGDYSGIVSQLGEGVSKFSVGDEVYGQAIILAGNSGAFAQIVAANTKSSAKKPQKTSFEEAAALPLVGVSALQALEDHMKLKKGQKIFISGGAGGIGHIAIQIAKYKGAYVATTVREQQMSFVKSLGADEVIDFKKQAFEHILKDFDAVFDTVGEETLNKSVQIVKIGGIVVSMLGKPEEQLVSKYGVMAIGQMTNTDTVHLDRLAKLVDDGVIKVHVDKIFPLEEVQQAFTYQEKSHPLGKVVLSIQA